jgi:hypothetical protein
MIITARTRQEAECVLDAAFDEGVAGAIHYHRNLDGTALGFVKLDVPSVYGRGISTLLDRIRANPHAAGCDLGLVTGRQS